MTRPHCLNVVECARECMTYYYCYCYYSYYYYYYSYCYSYYYSYCYYYSYYYYHYYCYYYFFCILFFPINFYFEIYYPLLWFIICVMYECTGVRLWVRLCVWRRKPGGARINTCLRYSAGKSTKRECHGHQLYDYSCGMETTWSYRTERCYPGLPRPRSRT